MSDNSTSGTERSEPRTEVGRRIVSANDPPTPPQHQCDCCGGTYYSRRAALLCCGDVMIDGGQLSACPECDSARINVVSAPSVQVVDTDPERYRCADCGARFEEPVTRDRRADGGRRGLAKRLADADPNASLTDLAREDV